MAFNFSKRVSSKKNYFAKRSYPLLYPISGALKSTVLDRQNKHSKKLCDFHNLMRLLSKGVLSDDGAPSQALIALSDYLQLEHKNDLASLTWAWEKFFFRNTVTGRPIERWELENYSIGREWEMHRHKILTLLKPIGLFNSAFPIRKHYESFIIHGARIEDLWPRLQFISQLWLAGTRCKKIIVLTGERRLTADELDQNNWSFLPHKTTYTRKLSKEIEIMQYAWEVNSVLPSTVRELPITWVNTPNFKDQNGNTRRGITEDTINTWLSLELSRQEDELGACLAIANAPLTFCQHVVFERKLYERGIEATIETVGYAEEKLSERPIVYYLREIAALLWELNKLA